MNSTHDPRAVVLVEGESDREAVLAVAARRGRDLAAEGVAVLAMGGITNIGHFLDRLGVPGSGIVVAGLYDAGEETHVRRHLARTGLGAPTTRDEVEALGFFVCDADLEDELIRAIGPDGVETIFAAEGELAGFRTFQRQPAQRGRPLDRQLRRFIGTRSGRKIRYGTLLVNALPDERVPVPLDAVLAAVDPLAG
jgi:hypothetical protein